MLHELYFELCWLGHLSSPMPILASQVATFLRQKGSNLSTDLLFAWESRVKEHIDYWSRIFGLTDAKPFHLLQASAPVTGKLELVNGQYQLSLPKLRFISRELDVNRLRRLCISNFWANYHYDWASGTIYFSQFPLPEHNWVQWARAIKAANPQVKKASEIKLFEERYRAGAFVEADLRSAFISEFRGAKYHTESSIC